MALVNRTLSSPELFGEAQVGKHVGILAYVDVQLEPDELHLVELLDVDV